MNFEFTTNGPQRYFYLVDLAGSGEWQWLYPKAGDEIKLSSLPYLLPLDVTPPTGEDNLFAVFCGSENQKLHQLVIQYDGKSAPEPETFLAAFNKDCHIQRYAFFSSMASN